jgi:hypothetical protein
MAGMDLRRTGSALLAALLCVTSPRPGHAQTSHVHASPADSSAAHAGMHHDMHDMHDMAGMDMGEHAMSGLYGPYAMTREASGTSWQPDAAKHRGLHVGRGEWALMLHGMADLAYDHQGGPRGDEKLFASDMVMGMAQRPLGAGTLGLRAMLSTEPATIGKSGYPLLLQTGESADGKTPLIDRQHPHDLFMELAGSYSIARGDQAFFVYAGLPGEPALGPPAFMHRFSGAGLPQAPITHHWLDSTHITYGVVTAGVVLDALKVEGSAFRGREPDEERWDIESPKLDSHAWRLSWNPTHALALQVSEGGLESPEELEPDVNQERTTASAMFEADWSGGHGAVTFAWGRDRNRPGRRTDALLVEAAATLHDAQALFARFELVGKDELFAEPSPRAGEEFVVGELSAGYRRDIRLAAHVALGLGAAGTVSLLPGRLEAAYGAAPVSFLAFLHLEAR